MNIVVDTNVIVSALVFGGVPRRVFGMIERGDCIFFYSADIEDETRRVLRDKFGWDEERLDCYLPTLWGLGKRVTPRQRVNAVRTIRTTTAFSNVRSRPARRRSFPGTATS
jgi:predicted nucleic acid-binding protein